MTKKKPPLGRRSEHMKKVLMLFGGLPGLSAITKVSLSGVSQWRKRVPMDHHKALIEYARANSIAVTAEDLLDYERAPAVKSIQKAIGSKRNGVGKEHRVMS